MDEKDFELLQALSECASITQAAERLYITQSAISKRIKSIEHELGCDLLIRSHRGIRFTPAGEVVLRRVTHARDELAQLRRELDASQNEPCGTLRAGFSISYTFEHLPALLCEYHRRYPRVHLSIMTGKSPRIYNALQSGALDIAVLRGDLPWDGMQYLLEQEQICVATPAGMEDVPLSSLTYIRHETDPAQATLMMRWLHENDLARDVNEICVDDLLTCTELVRRGVGWALLPEIALRDFNGTLRPCSFANGEPFVRRMHIDCQNNAEHLPQVRALVDMMKEMRSHS